MVKGKKGKFWIEAGFTVNVNSVFYYLLIGINIEIAKNSTTQHFNNFIAATIEIYCIIFNGKFSINFIEMKMHEALKKNINSLK